MSDTQKAAASLLHKTTLDVLRRCRGNDPNKNAETLAQCANLMMVGVLRSNATLLNAIALDYAVRVAAELPPLPAKRAPKQAEFRINLLEPSEEK